MISIDFAALPRQQRAAMRDRAPHLGSIFDAVEFGGVGFAHILRAKVPFYVAQLKRPTIFLIGDDYERAHGPDAFDQASLEAVAERAQRMVIISCAAEPRFYDSAALAAAIDRVDVVIVETQPDQEIPWVQFIQGVRPDMPGFICTVEGGNA